MLNISDATLRHLQEVADLPDLTGTPYEIVETLGRGGMGTVYLAIDHRLDREVALKVVQFSPGADIDVDRLLREARVLARLEHPGIVPVHDAGLLPDGRAFYAMKRVRGQRLDEHARSVSLPERLRAFQRICEAVAFAHAHGVIHRDLKPENVMVGPFGEVLVMDWGVAKVRPSPPGPLSLPSTHPCRGEGEEESPHRSLLVHAYPFSSVSVLEGTAHGTILGTPGYMAPEQERGEIDQIDERTDVWALGALLQFLLGNEAPSRPLQAIRQRAMAEDPAARYQKVEDLSADLALYLAGLPVGAHPEGVFETIGRFIRRYRVPILLVLAYVVMRAILLLVLRR